MPVVFSDRCIAVIDQRREHFKHLRNFVPLLKKVGKGGYIVKCLQGGGYNWVNARHNSSKIHLVALGSREDS